MISNITTNLPDEWEVDILLNSSDNIQFEYRGNIVSLQIKEPKNRMSLIYQIKVLIKRLYYLRKMKKTGKYMACISLLDSANVANILTGKDRCKTIITAVNMASNRNSRTYRWFVFPLIRLFYNSASVIIAQNDAIKNDLMNRFGITKTKYEIIYNGIDARQIEEIAKEDLAQDEEKIFTKERTVITAGRMAYAKGQWHLVRAFHLVTQKVQDAKLVIFGEGELKEYLQELVKEYKLEDSVYIKGFDNKLDKYIAASALFAFPSMVEGMPTVLLEAMTCETACLVTDFRSGAREILDYPLEGDIDSYTETDYGIIVPLCGEKLTTNKDPLEKNEIILAETIVKLLQDDDLRKHFAKQAKIRSQFFDMENIIQQWIKVIES